MAAEELVMVAGPSLRPGKGADTMWIDRAVRVNLWLERRRRLVLAVMWTAFAVSCAHYARFIRLPEIVVLPAVATGLLTGLRYAVWDGWLKRRLEARIREAGGPRP